MKAQKLLFAILLLLLLTGCFAKVNGYEEVNISIIPMPAELTVTGGNFQFNGHTEFVVENQEQRNLVEILKSRFQKAAGWELKISEEGRKENFIQLRENNTIKKEAYKLSVKNNRIVLEAGSYSGFLYGLESLRQLLPPEIENKEKVNGITWQIPALVIYDEPRFQWRGLMLDVSRHFFEKDYVLKVIDRLAMLKMNTLHLHLVDDQGWRIEIKKYPKLTTLGGFRVDHEDKHWNSRPIPSIGEEATFGGFYTQEEIKEIVAYAGEKGIKVIPEIEMPAHVMSALAAYPELSCNENKMMVPSGGVWPITEIYCAGKETTFEFLEDVLLEVMELFPSKYIHVGGDEATKTNWETCPHCQKRMQEEGLEDVEELQSYFIKRMEQFISSRNRILIGWDEILEGGLAPGAAVMSWRGTQGGWEASVQGHDVVMTPGSHVYFDHYQGNPDDEPLAFGGYTTLSKVYEFDPVVDSMSVAQKKHVLGGQANLWSEYIPTNSHSEYMLFPRTAALAEVLWTPKEITSWEDFSGRIKQLFIRFDYLDINYAKSAYAVTTDIKVDLQTGSVRISLENEFSDSVIRFALNEEDLNKNSTVYNKPITISETTTVKAGVFEDGEMPGKAFEKTFDFHKGVGKKVEYHPKYHTSYQGAKEVGMVNVLRGTKNFHDGQWQAWLEEDMEVIVDLAGPTSISRVTVGSMENQGSGIYFPLEVEILISQDGKNYKSTGKINRDFKPNGNPELKEFEITFRVQETRFVKVKIDNLGNPPTGGSAWLFIDEIIIK